MYEERGGREVRQLPDQAPEHLHRDRRGGGQTRLRVRQVLDTWDVPCPAHSHINIHL